MAVEWFRKYGLALIEWPGLCRAPGPLSRDSGKLVIVTMQWWPSAAEFADRDRRC